MKPLYLLAFITAALAGPPPASAQDTTYFDSRRNPVDPLHADFFETKVQTDSGSTFADHWMNGKLKITGTFAADMKTRVGTFAYYDSTGSLRKRIRFTGKDSCPETDYYPGGQVMMEGNINQVMMKGYSYFEKDGDWTAYYPTGKLKAKASFKDGQQAAASFYNEDGSTNNAMNVFYQEADYPGGSQAWLRFLNKTLRYPDEAVNHNQQGTVVIHFKVSKDGKTSDFSVVQSASASLDKEALRVIKASGDWQPAIYGGTPTDTYKSQPLVFKLESQ
ncbi:MAG TPA: TonB family protein [Puia sp.]|jgi:TonB family protein|nr:TonB family protein [Puia sp.]